jgi:hypothetical protein
MHEDPLHDVNVDVWFAMNAKQIIGPILYEETIDDDRYVKLVLTEFFTRLTKEKGFYAWF